MGTKARRLNRFRQSRRRWTVALLVVLATWAASALPACREKEETPSEYQPKTDSIFRLDRIIIAPIHWRIGIHNSPQEYFADIGKAALIEDAGPLLDDEEDWHVQFANDEQLLVHCWVNEDGMRLWSSVILHPDDLAFPEERDLTTIRWLERGLYWGMDKDLAQDMLGLEFEWSAVDGVPSAEKGVHIFDMGSAVVQQAITLIFVDGKLVAVGNYVINNAQGAGRTSGEHFDTKWLLTRMGVPTTDG